MAAAAERPDAARGGLLARYPLVSFFLLSFVFTWGYIALHWALQLPKPMYALAAAGPTVAAFLILAVTSGKPGVLHLLRSYVHWRVGVRWYLVSLIGVQVLMLLAFVVVPGGLADFAAPDWSFLPFYLGEAAFTLLLAGGPLLEEGGWRGFALPRLQRLHGPLIGTIILGALWSLWHLQIFVGPLAITGPDATFVGVSSAFVLFTIALISFSIIMTWVLNNCGGSVLLAILLHWAFDMSPAFVRLFPSTTPYYVPVSFQGMGIAIVFGIAALVIVVATRGQLGYQRYQREVEFPATAETAR
ncbi:CPBP family intramembrane glutamic endopeptidase [Arthrobacter cavernae]|uniref:CPBP family intramembrane metalloprotease n=1 Tax=Arthrobacter cavernae TaxID=2817681 RepID=A0A939HL61_9MICC|nr:CPBP family intramembrane glutamic endopeptidase [Arthrobacter cavernae]MBO1269816.1 CPBP family intramembrane metalloprotease [Arthrobacter cavernae]